MLSTLCIFIKSSQQPFEVSYHYYTYFMVRKATQLLSCRARMWTKHPAYSCVQTTKIN